MAGPGCIENYMSIYTRSGQNNGNTKKFRTRICVDCIEGTSIGNTQCSSIRLHSVMLV
jgi:hypothetical protein